MTRVRNFVTEAGPWPMGLAVMTFWLMVWSVLRAPIADYGIHVSVAERLIAGDRLYEEVWDNKDPLYFLSLAGARAITPLGDWFLGIGTLFATGLSVYCLARAAGTSRSFSVLVGWVVAPVIVIALIDPTAGISPAAPAAFAAIAFAVLKRPLLSGLVLSVVPFFQIALFPVALTAVVVVIWFGGRDWWRGGLGLGLGVLCVLTLLTLRHELLPYLNSLLLNVGYAQSGGIGGTRTLSSRIALFRNPAVQLSAVSSILALGIVRLLPVEKNIKSARSDNGGIWWAAAWCIPAVALVLLVMGKWPGHAKLLMIPGVMAVVAVASSVSRDPRLSRSASVVSLLLLGILVAALPSPVPFVTSLEYARAAINQSKDASSQAKAIAKTGSPTTYARVGQGEDPGHAIGLREWDLACPRITQYWWESSEILQMTSECIATSDVVLVTDDLYGPVSSPTWEAFQNEVENVLAEDFLCDREPGFRVCTKVT